MKRGITILAFLLVFIGLGLADSCSGYGDCDECVAHMPCGWCGDYGTCHEGDGSGADDGTCSDPDWSWYSSECEAETCSQYTTCSTCTPISICGWCSNLNSCYEGTYSGPDNDACTSANWDWYMSDCSADTCSQYDSCSDCVAHATCGWCTTGGGCKGGTGSGSTDGQCSDPNWAWYSSECVSDQCAQYDPCTECVSHGSCGWCLTGGGCRTGSGSGASDGYCSDPNWAWVGSECSGPPPACDYDTCSDCTGHSGCGWCLTSSQCMEGDSGGSDSGTCNDPNWAWAGSECGSGPGQCGTGRTDVGGVCMSNQCNANTAGGIISAIADKAAEELDDIADKTTDSSVDIATNIVSGIITQGVADRLVSLDSLKGLKSTGGSGLIAKAKRLMGNAVDRGLRFVIRKASQFGVSEQIANQAMSSAFEKLQQRVASVATSTSVGGLSTALKPAIRDYVVEPVIGTETYKSEISSLSPSITCASSYSPNMFSSKFQSMGERGQFVQSSGNTLKWMFTNSYMESAAQFISTNPMILTATGGSAASVYPTWKSAQLVSVAGVVVIGMYESYGVKGDALDCYELMGGSR